MDKSECSLGTVLLGSYGSSSAGTQPQLTPLSTSRAVAQHGKEVTGRKTSIHEAAEQTNKSAPGTQPPPNTLLSTDPLIPQDQESSSACPDVFPKSDFSPVTVTPTGKGGLSSTFPISPL